MAQAQATRTWVSGVGDDANPCSRTAPCKTFAGAISKTASGGEINALDPGGFGAVTITKSISIVGDHTLAGILAAGTSGVIVNAAAGDVVTLRGLDINGAGTGLNGIRFLAGAALYVEDCAIYGFTQKAIDFEPTTASQLFVKDTVLRNNNNGVNGGGILIRPLAPGNSVRASLEHVRAERNTFGVRAEDFAVVTLRDSVIAGSGFNGVVAVSAVNNVVVTVENTLVALNGTGGLRSDGGNATIRLSNVTISGNGTGLVSAAGGDIISFGNNHNAGNTVDGGPTTTIPLQ
jgi:hypothetical protein